MNPVLDGLGESGEQVSARLRHCPECLTSFQPIDTAQLFCCKAHRVSWNNRNTVRGARLTPLAIVARVTRNGSRGAGVSSWRASQDFDRLIRRYADEDRQAGRMTYVQYVDARYATGYDPE